MYTNYHNSSTYIFYIIPVAGQKWTDLTTLGLTREHLVMMPSRQTRLPRLLAFRVLGVTCLPPKLPSNPMKKSSVSLAYVASIEPTNSFKALWKADTSSNDLSRRAKALSLFWFLKSLIETTRRDPLFSIISRTSLEKHLSVLTTLICKLNPHLS